MASVGEGQDGQHVADGDFTGIDGGADAAAVLEGDGGALVGNAIENGVGQQVAHGAFLDAADFAGAFELVGGGADDLAGHFLDGAEEGFELALEVFIGDDRGVDQVGLAFGLGDDAIVIPGDGDVAEILAVLVGLDDGHFDADRVGDHCRVGAGGAFGGVGEEGVAVAADDHVDQRQGGGDVEVFVVADVAEQDDLVDAGRIERFGGAADILDDVVEFDIAGRGDFGGIFGGGADDADLFAADIEDDGAADLAAQAFILGDVEIAADDGEFGCFDELQVLFRAVVEFVVAGGDHVKAHLVEEVGNDLGLVGGVVERALEIVAGREQQRIACFVLGAGVVDDGLEAGNAAKAFAGGVGFGIAIGVRPGDRIEARMEVVDVQDVECEFGMGGGRKTGAEGERSGAQQSFFIPVVPS